MTKEDNNKTPEELKNTFDQEIKDLSKSLEEKIKNFDSLMEDLSSAHDKKKTLWKQIYENAVKDRRNAYIMYTDLYGQVHGDNSQHAIHGPTLAKYMERLTKSNDQLIKLAEIIEEAVDQDEDEITDSDSLFEQLEKNN